MKSGWCMAAYFILRAHAHHHPQRQRHPLGRAQRFLRLAADAGRGRRLRAGDQGQRDQLSDPMFCPAGYHCYYYDAVKKGYSGVAVYSRVKPDNDRDRLRLARIRHRGPLHRGAVQEPERGLGLPAFGLVERGPAAGQVPLPRRIHAVPARPEAPQARLHPVRRLEHRAQADRPAQLEIEPEELRLPARGARVARRALRRRAVRRRVPRGQRGARPLHVVVEPRRGVGQERRLAHRLPGAQPAPARQRARAPRSTSSSASPITRRSP